LLRRRAVDANSEEAHEDQDDDDPSDGGGDKQEAAGRDVMPGPGDCTPLSTR
jgi:hypothetical protein